MSNLDLKQIENMIYVIRGARVMIDSDLAKLYSVETRQLNRQVRRNIDRFPSDFAFSLTKEEYGVLKCQFGTSKTGSGGKHKLPMVFTENGVAMLSSVLGSKSAIKVNIAIMRIFTKLRSFLILEKGLSDRIDNLEDGTNKMFKIVFERLDTLEEEGLPTLSPDRKKIGFND